MFINTISVEMGNSASNSANVRKCWKQLSIYKIRYYPDNPINEYFVLSFLTGVFNVSFSRHSKLCILIQVSVWFSRWTTYSFWYNFYLQNSKCFIMRQGYDWQSMNKQLILNTITKYMNNCVRSLVLQYAVAVVCSNLRNGKH